MTIHAIDTTLLAWFGSMNSPLGVTLGQLLTRLGNPEVLIPVVLLGAALLFLSRARRWAVILLIVSLSSYLTQHGIKLLVDRPRPEVAWRSTSLPNSPSFPSGHAFCSMAIYPTVALLLGRRFCPEIWRGRLFYFAVLLALAIGLTRPYLGVHYPLDVLAGWVGGLVLVGLAWRLTQSDTQQPAIHP